MAKETKPKPNFIKRIVTWIKAHKFWSIIFFLISLGLGSFIYFKFLKPKSYETFTVIKRDLTQMIEVSGEIDAQEKAILSFPAYSRLSWVGIKEGDWVKKWQAIASVDTQTLQKQLKQDLNNFGKEFRDHDQTLDDYDFYGTPDLNREVRRILEKAQFDLDNEVLDVEIKDLAIKLSTINTPIAGIVTNIDKPFAGVTITPADKFEIVNPDTLYFSVQIDEIDVALVKEGQTAQIILDAYEVETLSSSINYIDFHSSLSDGGGTVFLAKLSLPQNDGLKYRLGMNGEAFINVASRSGVLAIPLEAAKTINGDTVVQVLISGKTQERQIGTGIETDEYLEVTSGLEEEDVIIIGE